MILVVEPTWTGTMHAPGNSATIQTVSRACPDEEIRVFADPSHLAELQQDSALTERPGISFHPITLERQFLHRPHLVSLRRFLRELATLRRALHGVPRDESCLVFLISTTSTAIFAASLLMRTRRRRIGFQVGLHGNLNDLTGWRPRNPLTRALDTRAALTTTHPHALRFLVLEQAIKDELSKRAPPAAARTDVLELPVNVGELASVPETDLTLPLKIGFVGQATEAKGISHFLDAVTALKGRHGDGIECHLVGRLMPGSDPARFAMLGSPVSDQHLPRPVFQQRLGALQFVFLPYQPGYYELSASGALLDAITWLKPIIAMRTPIVASMFETYGDIGYLCDSPAQMIDAVSTVIAAMDSDRYRRQCDTLRQARSARMPEALAAHYQTILRDKFNWPPPRG